MVEEREEEAPAAGVEVDGERGGEGGEGEREGAVLWMGGKRRDGGRKGVGSEGGDTDRGQRVSELRPSDTASMRRELSLRSHLTASNTSPKRHT